MPVTVVRGSSASALWRSCVDAFLDGAGPGAGGTGAEGPVGAGPSASGGSTSAGLGGAGGSASASGWAGGRPSAAGGSADAGLGGVGGSASAGPGASSGAWIWLSTRHLRDLLLEAASARGQVGWLGPPISLASELPERFGVQGKPVGLLTRRRYLGRHAARLGREILGREPSGAGGVIRGHMLDSVLSELLPEGVAPEEVAATLRRLERDDFARRRNRWVVEVYRAYLVALGKAGLFDMRSANAIIAAQIEAGNLRAAIGGARKLHIYGIATPNARRRMFRALAGQQAVEVYIYLPAEPEPDAFFDGLAARTVQACGRSVATGAARHTGGPPPGRPRSRKDRIAARGDDAAAGSGGRGLSASDSAAREQGPEDDGAAAASSPEQLSLDMSGRTSGAGAGLPPAAAPGLPAAGAESAVGAEFATARGAATVGSATSGMEAGPVPGVGADDSSAPTPGRAPPATDIRVQPVPDATREMTWVAREIKKIMAGRDTEPHEIAVVARSGRDNTRRAYDALARAGVPASARIRTPLAEAPALKALLSILRGSARNWDYRSLRSVLAHPYFDTAVDLRILDIIAAQRRVAGLGEWKKQLESLAQERRYQRSAEADISAFDKVRALLEPLREPRSEAAWIEATLGLLAGRGAFEMRHRVCNPVGGRWDVVRSDQRVIIVVEKLLREWHGLDHAPGMVGPEEWHALLKKILAANELALSTPSGKGVQLLEAHDASLAPFSHVFVVHANDGEFPRRAPASGVFSAQEKVRLAKLGLPLSHRASELRQERALWRSVTQQEGVVRISYRTTRPGGTPLLPSLMVPKHDPSSELPRASRPQASRPPVTEEEADQQAAVLLHEGLGARLTLPSEGVFQIAPARPAHIRRAIVAAVGEACRGPGLERYPRFADAPRLPNPWNGELRDPDVLACLHETFADHVWLATALESYARAPFVFLVKHVLHLGGIEEAAEDFSPLAFGNIAHEILARFYGGYVGGTLPPRLDEEAENLVREIAEQVCNARQEEEWLGSDVLRSVSLEDVTNSVAGYLEWELGHLKSVSEEPVAVEHMFGFQYEEEFLEASDVWNRRSRMRVRGRVDRIDRDRDGCHHVLDYKSSITPGKSSFSDGTALQGIVYSQALANQGFKMGSCRYRAIKSPRRPINGGMIKFDSDEHHEALRLAVSIPARICAGYFEPVVSRLGRWQPWDPGIEIRRNDSGIESGHRFVHLPLRVLHGAASRAADADGQATEADGKSTEGGGEAAGTPGQGGSARPRGEGRPDHE